MHGADSLKVGRGVEAFGNLAKPLSVHSFVIVLLQNLKRTLHLVVHLLLALAELFCVDQNLFLLRRQLALKFADLTLKELHLLRPREPLSLSK